MKHQEVTRERIQHEIFDSIDAIFYASVVFIDLILSNAFQSEVEQYFALKMSCTCPQ
jgi:hypothetical protein